MIRVLAGWGLALLAGPMAHAGEPVFVERAAELGITHSYTGGWEHFVGGGIAAFDCNGDALPELYAAGGASPATLLINRTGPGGDLVMTEATPASLALTGVTGAYPLDIDSDGVMDLAILRVGQNLLMQGQPDCAFRPFESLGADPGAGWTTAFSATWPPGQALPTMVFGNYVDRNDPEGPFGTCDTHRLLVPRGARYGPVRDLAPGFCTLSMLFSDWGRRGRADLRVSNDRHYYVRGGAEQMWAMEDPPRLWTGADGWQPLSIWGMGIASRDITGDGVAEVVLTSMGDQKLRLPVTDRAGPAFAEAPFDTGITAHRPYTGGDGRPSTGWHAVFGDVDNDGRDDLFIAKGNVEAMPDSAMADPNNLLMQRADGTFAEAGLTAGIASLARGRGAVLADLTGDGRLDLAVVNRGAVLELYQNVTQPVGQWAALSLHQPGANPDAIGAWIELRAGGRLQSREFTVGGGHAGGVAGPAHFGLGTAREVEVRVIWPGGQTGPWQAIEPGRHHRISRPQDPGTVTTRPAD